MDGAHTGREGKAGKRSLCTILVIPLLKQADRTIPI